MNAPRPTQPRVPAPPIPGIGGLMAYRPETGGPLRQLAQALLRGPSSLSEAERELIATAVSRDNACGFCERSHAATANVLAGEADFVARSLDDPSTLSPRLQALLTIAHQVAASGRAVDDASVQAARDAGADDVAIHDTVLVAAAFCMFNRYVDGLGATTPEDPDAYLGMGQRLATEGYGG